MTLSSLGGWARTAAATWLLVVGCLAAWSLAPVVFGWRPVVIVTGSMEPVVHRGDVVLVDPRSVRPRIGQVALVRDAEMPTGSKVHRVVAVAPDGSLTTKGDANQSDDARPAQPGDVEGVARLLVPMVGRVALLRSGDETVRLWIAATVLSALVLALVPPPRPEPLS
jgi:signal peptidase